MRITTAMEIDLGVNFDLSREEVMTWDHPGYQAEAHLSTITVNGVGLSVAQTDKFWESLDDEQREELKAEALQLAKDQLEYERERTAAGLTEGLG